MTFPFKVKILEVKQPFSNFYCAVLPASLLLQVAFSDTMKAEINNNGIIELQGTQRVIKDSRLKLISEYINRIDSAFPNSIILAANFTEDGYILEEDFEQIDDKQNSYNQDR